MRVAAARLALVAPLALLLSGCAAAAIPVLAGSLVGKKAVDGPRTPAEKPPRVEVLARPGVPAPDPAALAQPPEQPVVAASLPAAGSAELPAATGPVPLPPQATIALAEMPEAAPSAAGADYSALLRFATVRAAPPLGGKPRQSALIDPVTLTALPKTGPCTAQKPAVAIDIDPGSSAFNLDDPPLPAAGLADALAQLRLSGLSVLWVSALPASAETRLRTILQATGLDPDKADSLLLLRRERDRKAARLRDAARSWCIVAISGDRRSDFEEAYDYLRDPDGPIARTLDVNLGNGWFLTPLPIQ